MTDHTPPTDQQLDEIEARANAAIACPEAEVNGRKDGQHTWRGSLTHLRCELCGFTRPRGERAEEAAVLVAEVRRLRAELATARADTYAAVAIELEGIDFHPNAKATCRDLCRLLAGRFRRKGLEAIDAARSDGEETHVVADDSDDPEHIDDCPGCEPETDDQTTTDRAILKAAPESSDDWDDATWAAWWRTAERVHGDAPAAAAVVVPAVVETGEAGA